MVYLLTILLMSLSLLSFEMDSEELLDQVLDSMNGGASRHLGQIAELMYEWEGRVADELGLSQADVADIKCSHCTELKLQS